MALSVPNPTDWLSTLDTCRALHVSRPTLDRWAREGIILRYDVAGHPAYWRAEVGELAEALQRTRSRPKG